MSTLAPPKLPPQAAYTNEPVFRLSVDQYHDLIRSGKLTTEDPVELLEGIPVFKMPKNPLHSTVTEAARSLVAAAMQPGWYYRTQEPVTLEDGEPEPDGAVVAGSRADYVDAHPGPADVALIIEVAETTLARDRGIKLRSYARAGIAQYWIVNLIDWQIEAYSDVDPGALPTPTYRRQPTYKIGQMVPLIIGGHHIGSIPVAELLPQR